MKIPRPLALLLCLAGLLAASRAEAIIQGGCANCTCSSACSAICSTSGGPLSTCGAAGKCVGSSGCGGGGCCLTTNDAAALLQALGEEPRQALASEPRVGAAAARLTVRLAGFVEEGALGAVFAPATGLVDAGSGLRTPDLAFRPAAAPSITSRPATPALVAEVLPTPAAGAAIEQEARTWLAAGARVVLVVDPFAQTVTVHRAGSSPLVLGADDRLEIADLLPGWSVRVADLFD